MEGKPPAWLTAIDQKLPVERVSTIHYLNVKQGIELARPLLGEFGERLVKGAGLDNVLSVAMVSGLEGTGCVAKTWVRIDGEPRGLFALFGSEPLRAEDLAPIPKDALFAIAARLQPAPMFAAVSHAIEQVDPATAGWLANGVKQLEETYGVRLNDDLLQSIGDSVCIYNSPGEGGLLITGFDSSSHL